VKIAPVDFALRDVVAAPVERVEAALFDPAFFERLGDLPNVAAPELLSEAKEFDGAVIVRWVRYRFTGEVSGAVRRVVDPEKMSWIDESRYDLGAHEATHQIFPDQYGSMLRCSYDEALTADGAGCVRSAAGQLSVKVPLVGGKVEKAIIGGLRDRAIAEAQVLERLANGA
jgi:Protein of unknown function (DUF2505)